MTIFTEGCSDTVDVCTESSENVLHITKKYQTIEHFWGEGTGRSLLRMQVPSRSVTLSNNQKINLYDTSGAYSSENFNSYLPIIRSYLSSDASFNNNDEYKTQLYYAKKGVITPEMAYVAARENQKLKDSPEFQDWFESSFHSDNLEFEIPEQITPEFVRNEIAQGRAVIPANKNHNTLEPMIIGRSFLVKVNVSANNNYINNNGIAWAAQAGADLVSLCSPVIADNNLDNNSQISADEKLNNYITQSPIPVGSAPIFDALNMVDGDIARLNWEVYLDALMMHAEAGVDYICVHAAVLLDDLSNTNPSKTSSKGGEIMLDWMSYHNQENFLHENFDRLCAIAKAYDICIILADGARSNTIIDVNERINKDYAIFGELTDKAWRHSVQVIVEGPGPMPMHMMQDNIKQLTDSCQDVPFYSIGSQVTQINQDDNNISEIIAHAMSGWYGSSLINYSPKVNKKSKSDFLNHIKKGIVGYKIAAHSADISKGHPNAWMRDYLITQAQYDLNWEDQLKLSVCSYDHSLNNDILKTNIMSEEQDACLI